MKKILIGPAFLALAMLASAQNGFKGTLEEAVAKAKNENKFVLLDFYSGG